MEGEKEMEDSLARLIWDEDGLSRTEEGGRVEVEEEGEEEEEEKEEGALGGTTRACTAAPSLARSN
jgi:hypothetical protein